MSPNFVGSKPKRVAQIVPDLCTGCLVCVTVCPPKCIDSISSGEATGYTVCKVDIGRCTGCTLCVKDCPWEAIKMVAATPGFGIKT